MKAVLHRRVPSVWFYSHEVLEQAELDPGDRDRNGSCFCMWWGRVMVGEGDDGKRRGKSSVLWFTLRVFAKMHPNVH